MRRATDWLDDDPPNQQGERPTLGDQALALEFRGRRSTPPFQPACMELGCEKALNNSPDTSIQLAAFHLWRPVRMSAQLVMTRSNERFSVPVRRLQPCCKGIAYRNERHPHSAASVRRFHLGRRQRQHCGMAAAGRWCLMIYDGGSRRCWKDLMDRCFSQHLSQEYRSIRPA